jgi:hypothetical protein
LDWCCQFALSDPFEEALQSMCEDHQHSHRDKTVLECESLFDQLINDAYKLVAGKTFGVRFDDTNGTNVQGTVLHVRSGIVAIKRGDNGAIIYVSWIKTDLSHGALNLLVLADYIRSCQGRHIRYRRHLYLDRNQSYGEIMLARFARWVIKIDYMMKLRAKFWESDSSVFHLIMNKGSSVHVCCVKERIEIKERIEKEIADKLQAAGLEEGDYHITWIDSFCSNTGQGGYETLCVVEADLAFLKALYPGMVEAYMFSSGKRKQEFSRWSRTGLRTINRSDISFLQSTLASISSKITKQGP